MNDTLTARSLIDDAVPRRLPHLEAALSYLEPMAGKPRSLEYEPPPGVPRTTAVHREHRVTIRDVRPAASTLSLEREGFQLLAAASSVADFYDQEAVRTRYYAEAVSLLEGLTGASHVVVFDHTTRRRIPGATDRSPGTPRQPVPRVHNDYTVKSGPQRVRDLLGEGASDLLRKRFAVVNLWRAIRGPVQDAPLAVADARSVDSEDLVATDLVYPDRTGEIYYVKFNPSHRWFYASAMREDEVMLIKCFDSAEDGRARFVPHAAFVDPTAPAGAPPRESIELRTLVFYGE
ncbi:MAG TPA: CmcJ/NvfI family oxidoreductase [Steroidobacteraceae bacterium]|nr:CmcJ/NvfI family oxidoreductase [Steroidobacteraceae bacterium]